MQFTAQDYFEASVRRVEQAKRLYERGEDYALAMYCAGLAVECLLRAFRFEVDTTFHDRHDLWALLKTSRLQENHDEFMRRRGLSDEEIGKVQLQFRAAMNEISALWHNSLRFAADSSLRAHLKRIGRLHGKGDPLKRNASSLLEAASTVLGRGTVLWTHRRKSKKP